MTAPLFGPLLIGRWSGKRKSFHAACAVMHPDARLLLHPDAASPYRGFALTIASDPQ
jgi:hypothetical protein